MSFPLPADAPIDPTIYMVVQPYDVPPEAESYYGLLTDPVGRYGRAAYGGTTAFTLRGTPLFRWKAYNMFSSFGGESIRFLPKSHEFRGESREPILRKGNDPDSEFFCMPPHRVKIALRLYLYGQIYKRKAAVQAILDDEGDFLDSICTNEDEMMHEAARLAESFYLYEMPPDHRTVAGWNVGDQPALEHSVREQESDNHSTD